MSQRPVAIGMLLCEQVIIEEKTRNATPVNCFRRRAAKHFPSEASPFMVFAMLTDGLGEMPLEIVIERLDTFEEVYRRSFPARFPSPLQEVRCLLRIGDCSFPIAGHYQVTLLVDNGFVAQRKMILFEESSS